MTNVVSMGQSYEFLLARAARHRRAGRYDEAITLLSRAKEQFGLRAETELEAAYVYEAIGCDDDAFRAYLRVVRLHGEHQAEALYHLAVLSARKTDVARAASYYQRFAGMKQKAVSEELADALGARLAQETQRMPSISRKARVHALEKRAVAQLQAGKAAAAARDMRHAIALIPSAQRFSLLACCMMIRGKYDEAIEYAEIAHELAPARVQIICVLADVCMSAGKHAQARRWICLAAMRALDLNDMLAVAMESAKCGEDQLTLRLTGRMLKREPFFARAMMLRACALTNLGRLKEASRLFGRLSVLTPEDIVSRTYYRMTKDGVQPQERLSIGVDLAQTEGIELTKELVSWLYEDPETIRADKAVLERICADCAWAIRSPMAGSHVKTVVLILLSMLDTDETQQVLLDALVDPQVPDSCKGAVLQVMTSKHGFQPYDVDFGGRLVRLAAGGVSSQPVRSTEMNQKIVQRVSDALAPDFPDAPRVLLPIYLAYTKRYGTPNGRHEDVCAAALEYMYHLKNGRTVSAAQIASRYGVPRRLCMLYVRRLCGAEPSSSEN